LTISRIVESGSYADFPGTTTCGTSLAAGASCTISVIFRPSAQGPRAATLTFTDNALNSPQTATLSGTGL
jgi:hypothetical protein